MTRPFCLPAIADPANPLLALQLQSLIDNKTKPLGALGQLEQLALQLGLILNSAQPELKQPQLLVFAADHGLTRHGISAYPSAVTAQMVDNFLQGGGAVNVFAKQQGIALKVVDAGVAADLAPHPLLLNCKLSYGSQDALTEPAMSKAQCHDAIKQGIALVTALPGNVFIAGEMGIGNTSAASLLLARLGEVPLSECVGSGTGLDSQGVAHKTQILMQVLAHHSQAKGPFAALAALGGLEIAMMVGALIQGAHLGRVLLIDGFIAGVALLVADLLAPGVRHYAVFAHHSAEPGHAHLLQRFNATPLLDLKMRLGEGSGAVLAYPLLVSACLFLRDMASFSDAGVSTKHTHE